MKRKGFTLIELLAVIVILAIIALIAVPVIMNIINKANKSAFKDTAYGIISAGELYFAEQQLDINGMIEEEVTFDLSTDVNAAIGLQIKGQVPNGVLKVNKNGNIALAVYNGRYCAKKEYMDNDIIVTEDLSECKLGLPTISELESRYTFTYYNSLSQAVTDVNNGEIGVNANDDKEGAFAGVYTTNGQTYVVLLKDTTEATRLQLSADMTLNLGGHKLTMAAADTVGIDITAKNTVIEGRLSGSAIVNSLTSDSTISFIQTSTDTNLTVNGGSYYVGSDGSSSYIFVVNGKLNISNAVINTNGTTIGALGVYIKDSGEATITDCDITSTSTDGKSYGIYNYGTATITDSNITTLSTNSKSYGFINNGTATISNTDIFADSPYTNNADNTGYDACSIGVWVSNTSTTTLNNCNITGTQSGVEGSGEIYINGGTHKSYGHGGIYITGGVTYIKDATLSHWDYDGEYGPLINVAGNAGSYISGGASVYMDNCNVVSSEESIVLKKTNVNLYVSNTTVNTNATIGFRIDNNNKLHLGVGNNFTANHTTNPAAVIVTNETYIRK